MKMLAGAMTNVSRKVGTIQPRSVTSVLSLVSALAFIALDAGAAPVVPVDSGAGGENGRNAATVNLPGVAGISPFSARSFSFGGDRPEPTSGGGAGRFNQRLLTLVKPIDTNTPVFFGLAATGSNISTLTLSVPATGASAAATYTFTNSTVISDHHSDKGRPNNGQELEEVTLFYRRLQVQVGNVVRCFDFGTGLSC